ncbi:PQQ-binding-like beta-propeller repeat protein [Actinoplanes sp. NPDC024001]|uniref:outer membrane protein assembly factor BamB family protein n=1 Tax=Actinoplanes sp. NPDC024001 TaxID=3154598 RepID=UPI0033FD6F23
MIRTLALVLSLTAAPLWDHPGYDAEDSHFNPAETVINAGSVGRLATKWQVKLRTADASCSGPSAPVLSGDRLVTTDMLGISAYSPADGSVRWRYDWDDRLDNDTPALAVADGLVIAANGGCNSQSDPDGKLTALDLANGQPRWTLPMDMPIGSVVVDKGIVAISGSSPSDEDAVVAHRVRDGKLLWRKPNHGTTGVSADGVLLIHATDGFGVPTGPTTAVDISTGVTRWSRDGIWKAQAASPRADRFYATDTGSNLGALDAATGAIRWIANGKSSELIAADGQRVYRADGRDVEALHAGTGASLWKTRLTGDAGQPVRAADLLYAGSTVLRAADGGRVGRSYPGRVIVAGGRLYQVNGGVLGAHAR